VARAEVPQLAAAGDVSLCFIKPAYSKLSSSPTKLGELLAMGIPVIANEGVGDVAAIITATGGGICLRDFSTDQITQAVAQLPALLALQTSDKRSAIREKAFKYYDLHRGIDRYYQLYERIVGIPKTAIE
jgi:glycosyltransferase involved in cell wall biosynthesis